MALTASVPGGWAWGMEGQVAEAYGWFMLKQRNGSFGWKDAFPSIEFLVIFVQVPGSHFLFGRARGSHLAVLG